MCKMQKMQTIANFEQYWKIDEILWKSKSGPKWIAMWRKGTKWQSWSTTRHTCSRGTWGGIVKSYFFPLVLGIWWYGSRQLKIYLPFPVAISHYRQYLPMHHQQICHHWTILRCTNEKGRKIGSQKPPGWSEGTLYKCPFCLITYFRWDMSWLYWSSLPW